jgi:hypothetical protein
MNTPTSDDAKELIRLAVRMGIPPAEAIRRVMDHLTERRSADATAQLSAKSNVMESNAARGRARMRLLPGGGEVSAQRREDPSPTRGSSASA